MKIKALGAMIVAGAALGSQGVFAADGQINFTGQVTAQTCSIDGNGSGGVDFTVNLPTVSVSTLAAAGETAGNTPFTIALSNCTPDSGNVHTFFEAGPTTNLATGNLTLTDGVAAAGNVEIQLLNGGDQSQIMVGYADAAQNSRSVALNAGAATLSYSAQYVAVGGGAVPGLANSYVQYSIAYQ
ncbi:Major fimbrial subunit SMF-1 [compost metagenome]